MTPINEFEALLPKDHGLSAEQIETMRDLVDTQADMILDSYIQDKVDGKMRKWFPWKTRHMPAILFQ